MNAPDVSILMPTKGDRSALLARSVAAILEQEGPTFELIIDNGGGPIPPHPDERVTVLDRCTPLSGVLNRLAEASTGRLMNVFADDDVMLPGTLADIASLDDGWTYGCMQLLYPSGPREVVGGAPWSAEFMLTNNMVCAPTAFWTRQLFDEVGGFDESLEFTWDYEMWGRFGARSDPVVREHVDCFYSIWDGQVSSVQSPAVKAEVRALQQRWQEIGFGNRPCSKCSEPVVAYFTYGKRCVLHVGVCEGHAAEARADGARPFVGRTVEVP